MNRIASILALLLSILPTGTALAAANRDACTTPRAAIEGLLIWQQPDNFDAARAAACLNMPAEEHARDGEARAAQIKAVLDARGLFVDLESLPSEPQYTNASGVARYQLFGQLPAFYVEKVGDRWLWSAATLAATPSLYEETFVVDVESLRDRLPSWMRQSMLGLAIWQLLGLLLLVFVALLVRTLVTYLIVAQVRRVLRSFAIDWGDELVAVGRPLGFLAGAGVFGLLLPILRLGVRLNQIGLLAVRVVAVLSAVWAAYRVVDLFTAWMRGRAERTDTKLDDQLVPLVNKALKIFIVAVGSIFVLQNLDIDVAGLLAGLGLGGLAFALAAKDTVANLFGSATIFASRPFHVGDWVLIGDAEGIVESVGFRSTRIRTFYNSMISVPNAKVADSVIDNYGARRYRRFKTHIGVTYDTTPEQMQAFVEGMRSIVEASPTTRKDYYEIHFNRFGASALEILVYVFFEVPSWSDELKARHNFLLEVVRLAKALEVSFAFPTQTVHVASLAAATESERRAAPDSQQLAATVKAFGPHGEMSQPHGPRLAASDPSPGCKE